MFPLRKEKNAAEVGKLNSDATYKDLLGENVSVDTVNKSNTQGRTGQAAADWLNSAASVDPERIKRLQGLVKGRQRPAAAKGSTGTDPGLLNAIIANPDLFSQLGAKQKGETAGPLHAQGFDQFGKPMSDGAVKEVAQSRSSISSLNDLKDTLENNKQYLGVLKGWQGYIPGSPAQLARQQIDLVRQRVGKALEGGVLRAEDEKKYKPILARLMDEPEIALDKITYLIDNIEKDMQIFKEEQKKAGRRVSMDPAKPGVVKKEDTTARTPSGYSLADIDAAIAKKKGKK
jgi:hypothetical protein